MKWTWISNEKEWINASLDNVSISYRQILKERKMIDQTFLVSLAFLTILIRKKCFADWLINQPMLLNQNKRWSWTQHYSRGYKSTTFLQHGWHLQHRRTSLSEKSISSLTEYPLRQPSGSPTKVSRVIIRKALINVHQARDRHSFCSLSPR